MSCCNSPILAYITKYRENIQSEQLFLRFIRQGGNGYSINDAAAGCQLV